MWRTPCVPQLVEEELVEPHRLAVVVPCAAMRLAENRRGLREFLLRVREEHAFGDEQRRPAKLGLGVHARAVVDEPLDDRRLIGDDGADERRAAAPARIADAQFEQVVDVVRVVQQRVRRLARHRVVAEVGVRR